MDRYVYKLRMERIHELVEEKNYELAAEIADTMNFKKLKDVSTLSLISEIYENVGNYEKAANYLWEAYENAAIGRQIVHQLVELAIAFERYDDAIGFCKEYGRIAKNDATILVLRYKIAKGSGASKQHLIDLLETYLEQSFEEEWAYELVLLYEQSNQISSCVELCDRIATFFGFGDYVIGALEIKSKYQPLTQLQQELLDEQEMHQAEFEETLLEQKVYELNQSQIEVVIEAPIEAPIEMPIIVEEVIVAEENDIEDDFAISEMILKETNFDEGIKHFGIEEVEAKKELSETDVTPVVVASAVVPEAEETIDDIVASYMEAEKEKELDLLEKAVLEELAQEVQQIQEEQQVQQEKEEQEEQKEQEVQEEQQVQQEQEERAQKADEVADLFETVQPLEVKDILEEAEELEMASVDESLEIKETQEKNKKKNRKQRKKEKMQAKKDTEERVEERVEEQPTVLVNETKSKPKKRTRRIKLEKGKENVVIYAEDQNVGVMFATKLIKNSVTDGIKRKMARVDATKLNDFGMDHFYNKLDDTILMITNASLLDEEVVDEIREIDITKNQPSLFILIDEEEKIREFFEETRGFKKHFPIRIKAIEERHKELFEEIAQRKECVFEKETLDFLCIRIDELIEAGKILDESSYEAIIDKAIVKATKLSFANLKREKRGNRYNQDGMPIIYREHLF